MITQTANEQGNAPKFLYLEQGDEDALCPIMITEGPFEGFVYQYGVVSVSEHDHEDGAKLSYDYQLIEVPEDYVVVDEEQEQVNFETVIGDILTEIVMNSIIDDGTELDDDRETDTQ